MQMTYCPDCRTMQPVEDTHHESNYEGGSAMAWEQHYTVEDLACGHQRITRGAATNTAPGAPYAGPDIPVAASHHPRDLAAARAEYRAHTADPWGIQ